MVEKEERTYTTTPTGAKQLVCPPDIPKYNPPWVNEREQYLVSKGWERDGGSGGLPTVRDPKGSRLQGEMRDAVVLPNRGDDLHPTTLIRQLHVPPAVYSFTLEEALAVQTRRDEVGEVGPTPLERLDVLERAYNDLSRQLDQFKARVKGLLATDISHEKLKLGLRELVRDSGASE